MAVNALQSSSRLSLRTLGTLGMIGAPFLLLSILTEGNDVKSRPGEFFGLLFIGLSIFSVAGLHRLRATGTSAVARALLLLQMTVLSIASLWSVTMSFSPGLGMGSVLYSIGDMCWPLSMLLMLITGTAVAIRGGLSGWRRWSPLLCGLALPLTFAFIPVLGRVGSGVFFGGYAVLAWAALGYAVRSSDTNLFGQ